MLIRFGSRARLSWKIGRWVAAVLLVRLLVACNTRTLDRPTPNPQVVTDDHVSSSVNRQVDILFMVDNSSSMDGLQKKLLDKDVGFPVFMEVLKNIPAADGSDAVGLPDVHIAVISSDVGPGGLDLPERHCRQWGDEGRFQTAPRAPCTVSPLADGQYFLAASNNQAEKNYTGDITDAFTCIAHLGEGGCGFEGQLKSVRWALDPALAPPENTGFLRDDAFLTVVLITNEDDCSLPDDSDLATTDQELVSDPLGPVQFRCNEYGHLCSIDGTLQPPPRGAISGLDGCVSNDTPTGRLTRVADEVAFLKGLKKDPDKLLVAALTGPATPYDIAMQDQNLARGGTEPQPTVQHSCGRSSKEYADPAIRIRQWVQAFGDQGLMLNICADSFELALTQIATKLREQILKPACIGGTFETLPSGTPRCAVTDRFTNDHGQRAESAVPACAENGGATPCWTLDDDPEKCAGKKRLDVHRDPAAPVPTSLDTEISCALCVPGANPARPGCPS